MSQNQPMHSPRRGVPPVVASAEEWPEVPGAMVRVQEEGGVLPAGHWNVLSRVIQHKRLVLEEVARTDVAVLWTMRSLGPSGLGLCNGRPLDILLVAPFPSQKWWERAMMRGITGYRFQERKAEELWHRYRDRDREVRRWGSRWRWEAFGSVAGR